MHNASRLVGLYDEFSAFLAQINLCRGRCISDSHELSLFLQLFNGTHGEEILVCACMLDYITNPDPYYNCKKVRIDLWDD